MTNTMAAMRDIRDALQGALRLACADAGGFESFDRSRAGFWKSFRAALLLYPLFLLLAFRAGRPGEVEDFIRLFLVQTVAYAVTWLAFPVVMASVCDVLGRRHRYVGFVVAYNWAQIPQYGYSVILLGLGGGMDGAIATFPIFLYEGYVAAVALDIGGLSAAMIVMIDYLLGTGIDLVANRLL